AVAQEPSGLSASQVSSGRERAPTRRDPTRPFITSAAMRFLLPLAAVVPIALACGVTDNTPAPPLDLITQASPAEFALGDTARIHIDVATAGDRTVWIGRAGCNYDCVITAPSGIVYQPAEKVYCTLALLPPVKLEP